VVNLATDVLDSVREVANPATDVANQARVVPNLATESAKSTTETHVTLTSHVWTTYTREASKTQPPKC
jgi:hypothetical protein